MKRRRYVYVPPEERLTSMRLFVCPSVARWLKEQAERDNWVVPYVNVTDYSTLKPCLHQPEVSHAKAG